jgi:hypothetical protein
MHDPANLCLTAVADNVRTLLAIRDRIEATQIVACGMAHERVRWDDGRIVRRLVGEQDDALVRVTLCSHATRAKRLGCGHTLARSEARRALVDLRAAGALSDEQRLAFDAELEAIGHDIQLLDHRKGDAEKRRALLIETLQVGGGIAAATLVEETSMASIRALEREHAIHLDRLREWRTRVLQAIDLTLSRPVSDAAIP